MGDRVSVRRWYQLHASSWFILAIVLVAQIAVNLPYEYGGPPSTNAFALDTAWRRAECMLGGWPLRYLEIREPDYSESPDRDWSVLALAVDLLAGVAVLAIVVGAYEQRRRRRTKRWQLTLSDLCFLMLVVCGIFGSWNMMAHRYRTQQIAMFQLQIEGGTVTSQMFLPKVIIGPSEPSTWRGRFHGWLIDQLWNHEHPTAARLTKVNHESISALLQLREIRTLLVHDSSVTDEAAAALESLRSLERLQIDGPHLTDACVPTLQRLTKLRFLRIRNVQLSDDGISKLAALPNLVSLDVEGTSLTDRGLAAVAANRGLRDLNIARTQITSEGLRVLNGHTKLRRLWLASLASKPGSRAVKQVQLSDLPLLEAIHLPGQLELLKLSNLPTLTQLPAEWDSNEFWLPSWMFNSGFKILQTQGSPFPLLMQYGVNAKHLSLRDMPGLTTLDLDCREIESLDLAVTSLKSLSTARTNEGGHLRPTQPQYSVDDRLGELIGHNQSLQTLRLVNASLTPHGWSQLSSLRDLQSLELNGSNVTDEDAAAFSDATRLQILALANTQISDNGWKRVSLLPLLRFLDVSFSQITDLDLEGLPDFEKLAIDKTPLKSLRLKSLPKLRGYLPVTSSAPLVVEAVDVPALEGIHLEGPCVARMVLHNLSALHSLDLGGTSIDDEMLRNVGELQSLQRLILRDTDVTDATLSRIGDLQNLDHLDLENTAVTDAGLAACIPQLQLSELNLTGTNFSDLGLLHLSGQTQLRDLLLGRTNVCGPGLQHLSKVTSLRRLSLGETRVTSESIAHLQNLKLLEWLRLSDTNIDDASFQHLNRLPNLRSLFLNGTSITDQGIETYNVSPILRSLDISKTAVTAGGAIRIHGNRPNLKVHW